jgi:membrane protease YdiL (CAAX protease family)
MSNEEFMSPVTHTTRPLSVWQWGGVLFALIYPTIITVGYFVLAREQSKGFQQTVFLIVKVIQFAFPAVWVALVLREPLRTGRVSSKGVLLGAGFSALVVGAGWLLFNFLLRHHAAFVAASEFILKKIDAFGINTVWKFVLLAAFYSILHSLFEEYYWRWFVFRQLRRLIPLWPAIIVSALGFMSHHVIVLLQIFHDAPWLAWLLSAAVAVGGAFWAGLYERSASIFGPWLSHLLLDAGIFWIGYQLIHEAIAS